MELTLEDRLDLCEIPGRYGDSIDDRNWDQLRTIFTEDAVFDLTGVGSRVLTGIDDIVAFMEEEAAHPRTHMNTYACTVHTYIPTHELTSQSCSHDW